MTNILDINSLKILREETRLGITECKNSLLRAKNNLSLARKILSEQAIILAKKKVYRRTYIQNYFNFSYFQNSIHIVFNIKCETDFVARNEQFFTLLKTLAINLIYLENLKFISFEDIPLFKINEVKKNHIFFLQSFNQITIEKHMLKQISTFGENIKIIKLLIFNSKSSKIRDRGI